MQSTFAFSGPSRPKRAINLGGASSTTTHTSILDTAKARRIEREGAAQRNDAALKIQAWYRGRTVSRSVRAHMKSQFDTGNGGILWTRYLLVAWSGDEADQHRLGRWSQVYGQGDALISPFGGPEGDTWRVLVKQVAARLVQSLASNPQSPYALEHLTILNTLVSAKTLESSLPEQGTALSLDVTAYLLSRNLFTHISRAIIKIPLEAKSSPSLPPLIVLATSPFTTLPASSPTYVSALTAFTLHILSIPLLPNRLPIPSVTYLSSRLPFASLSLLDPSSIISSSPNVAARTHLLANLLAFGPARIPKATAPTLGAYLSILSALMDSLPATSLEPPAPRNSKATGADAWGSDSDSEDGSAMQVDSDSDDDTPKKPKFKGKAKTSSTPTPLVLDPKTLLRLQTLWSSAHISALITATAKASHSVSTRPKLFAYILSLCNVAPAKRERILSTVINSAGQAGTSSGFSLVKELWRGWVRSSVLGREEDPKVTVETLTDPANSPAWIPFLFLTEVYTHSLLTMGDDEFYSSAILPSSGTASVGKGNPLSLDELTAFSKKLLHIAFALYWCEEQTVGKAPPVGLGTNWEGVRDRVSKCLLAIHARDSRRPFAPSDHWVMSSQIDMQSFVDAAVAEEQQLDRPTPSTRLLTKRQMAFISPRLGILNNIPFAIPFSTRVNIFHQFVANDAHSLGLDDWYNVRPKHKAVIRRKSVAQDGFDQLGKLGAELKGRVAITFIDEWGNEEAGIDGGGVFKEFLTSLTKEAFDTDRGLWLATTKQELYPNPHSYAKESHSLAWYRFIGRVLGKALYEGILVDVAFASFFLAKWLGKQSYLDDLQSLDPELYQGLVFLKNYEGQVEEDLALNFTITHSEFGLTKSLDLIPNGSNIPVTRENRIQYIFLVANYRLNAQIRKQSEALFEGLADMIDPKWLRMFNQQELQILIGGVEEPVDIDDLIRSTVYGGLYDDSHPTIQAFWKVARGLDQSQRQALLRFVTSCSRPPLLGFKELNPRFSIRDAGSNDQRLPTSSTCVNLLKLPLYTNETVLRNKLLQAISSNAGFDLS